MGTKVKGLLRGLRYISQIFDEKEPEIEIGFPTDVKHVAHIGWDGPSASTPSWMNEFKSQLDQQPEGTNSGTTLNEENGEKVKTSTRQPSNPETRRRHASPMGSPKSSPKQSRRHRSASHLSVESQGQDSSGSGKSSRRHHSGGSKSLVDDPASVPKHSRGRKSKGSSKLKDRHTQQDNAPIEKNNQHLDLVEQDDVA